MTRLTLKEYINQTSAEDLIYDYYDADDNLKRAIKSSAEFHTTGFIYDKALYKKMKKVKDFIQ